VADVLTAALVSAVVALGVEWLAKPRLEARKERILRRYRARDEVRRLLYDILFNATKLKSRPPATSANDGEAWQAADAIVPAARSLEDAFRMEVMPFTRDEIAAALAGYVGFVRGVMESDRTGRDKGEQIAAQTSVIIDVLGGPGQGPLYWARRRYRARRLRELNDFLDA
jgi:hypothetical protein